MPADPFNPTEAQEAQTFVAWLRLQGLKFHHSPNETGSSPEARRRAVRVKREGTSPGFPDYIILVPPNRSHTGDGFTIFVELKRRKGGRVSPAQMDWIAAIKALDSLYVSAHVANGAEEAIATVSRFLRPGSAPVQF